MARKYTRNDFKKNQNEFKFFCKLDKKWCVHVFLKIDITKSTKKKSLFSKKNCFSLNTSTVVIFITFFVVLNFKCSFRVFSVFFSISSLVEVVGTPQEIILRVRRKKYFLFEIFLFSLLGLGRFLLDAQKNGFFVPFLLFSSNFSLENMTFAHFSSKKAS